MSYRRWTFILISLALLAGFFGLFLAFPIFYVLKGSVIYGGRWTWEFFRLNLSGVGFKFLEFVRRPLSYSADYLHRISELPIVVSLAIGLAVTVATTAVALPLALITVRRQFFGRRWVSALVMLPLILPPFVGAIGMKQMFARMGSVNLLLGKITWLLTDWGLLAGPWHVPDINWMGESGFWGVVILATLHLYPIMYLNVAASLASVDPSAEEAACNLGASRWNVFRRITFPLMLPGYFAGASIVFIWAFTDLGTPLILHYRNVVPVQIFDMVRQANDNPMAYALVVMVLAVTALAFVAARTFLRRSLRAQSSKGTSGETLRRATPWGTAFILLFILGLTSVAVIPHLAVVLSSLTTPSGWTGTVLPTEVTLENYDNLLTDVQGKSLVRDYTWKDYRKAVTNRAAFDRLPPAVGGTLRSLLYSSLATVGALAVGILIAWLLTRVKFVGQGALDTTVMMPLALPGVILAFGYLACFVGRWDSPVLQRMFGWLNPIENPVPLLVVSYLVRRLPYMVRSAVAGFQHVSPALEEASTNLGARPLTTLWRITLPLVVASLVAGAVLTFVFSMFEVSQSLVLAQERSFYPISSVLWKLFGRLGDGPYLASAMGVLGMVVLGAGLLIAGKFLGKRMGEIFRA